MATAIRDSTPSSDAAVQRGLTPDVLPGDREGAFQLWAYVHGQNATATATALGIPANTVRSWANRDGWRQRYELERGERFETVRRATELALLRAIPDTIKMFHKIVNGEGDSRQTLDKHGNLVTVEDHVPYQVRVNAGKELVALFNGPTTHHHHHTSDTTAPSALIPPSFHTTTAPDPAAPLTPDQLLSMTPDQIRQAPQLPPLTRAIAAAMSPDQRQAWEEARRRQRQAG